MIKKSNTVKAGIGYTLGNIFVKGINFIFIPLFSRILTPGEFGVFNVFISYDAIMFVVVGLAIHTSIKNANLEFKNKIDQYTSTIVLIPIINSLIFTVLVSLFGRNISERIGYSVPLLYLLIMYSFGSAIVQIYNQRLSIEYAYKKYISISLAVSVGNIVLSLIFIYTLFSAQRDVGRIVGASLSMFIVAIVIIVNFFRKAPPIFNGEFMKYGIEYSLPIVPHGIAQVLLAQVDRIMIKELVNDAAAGVYSLATNVKMILNILAESIAIAWSQWFYDEIEKSKIKEIQQRAIQLSGLFAMLTYGIMAIAPEVILILGGSKYVDGKYVVIPMILDAYIIFLYNIIIPAEYYKKKTNYIMIGTVLAAFINLITNYIFIMRYGYHAAAYTTLASYVLYLLLHIIITKRVIGFSVLPIRWLLIYAFSCFVMAVLDLLFVSSLIIRIIICLAAFVPYLGYIYKNKNLLYNGGMNKL